MAKNNRPTAADARQPTSVPLGENFCAGLLLLWHVSAVIEAARQHTPTRIATCQGAVLLVHDATELDYTSLLSLAGDLGQIGIGHGRGYICQNVLAIEAETGEVLGLMD